MSWFAWVNEPNVLGRPSRPGSEIWRYEAEFESPRLSVRAAFSPGATTLTIDSEFERFVHDLTIEINGRAADVHFSNGQWHAQACEELRCVVRYRFDLSAAAKEMRDPGYVMEHADSFVAPPSSWLVRPAEDPGEARYQLSVRTRAGSSFVTGLFPLAGKTGVYEAPAATLDSAPFSAFGSIRRRSISIGRATIEVAILPGAFSAGEGTVLEWIREAGENVGAYYGRFPVPFALVLIAPTAGDDVAFGTVLGNGGASIFINIGEDVTRGQLRKDWTMTHEMVHLGFPNLARQHHWLEEGIATYVEPISRARRKRLSPETMWLEFFDGLPKGQPESGDRGLDRTPTWGRTYWGGALFCFVVDLEIRRRTENRRSLDDVLRAILREGGNIAVRWPLDRVLDTADGATGVPVFRDMYTKMADRPVTIDLVGIFRRMGIERSGSSIEFNKQAPLAAIRTSITTDTAPSPSEPHR